MTPERIAILKKVIRERGVFGEFCRVYGVGECLYELAAAESRATAHEQTLAALREANHEANLCITYSRAEVGRLRFKLEEIQSDLLILDQYLAAASDGSPDGDRLPQAETVAP